MYSGRAIERTVTSSLSFDRGPLSFDQGLDGRAGRGKTTFPYGSHSLTRHGARSIRISLVFARHSHGWIVRDQAPSAFPVLAAEPGRTPDCRGTQALAGPCEPLLPLFRSLPAGCHLPL